jgi:hypothetical protein
MTEKDWQNSELPVQLSEFLFDYSSSRKLRLWACACGREVIPLFENPRIGRFLTLFEDVAEGVLLREDQQRSFSELGWETETEKTAGFSWAVAGLKHSQWIDMAKEDEGNFTIGLDFLASAHAYRAVSNAEPEMSTHIPSDLNWRSIYSAAQHKQLVLARDIFGNPFRPIAANPTWLTSTVVALASGIYSDRAFDRMPILADAMEEAGCDSADILLHCRGPGPHVRGCWVVDLLLGKQ